MTLNNRIIKKYKFPKYAHNNMKHRILTYKGVSMRGCEWVRKLGLKHQTFYARINLGMSEDKIFTQGLLNDR